MSNIFFVDTEFSERGSSQPLELISIAIVSLDGRELYAVSDRFRASECSEWVRTNVLALLPTREAMQRLAPAEIAEQVRQFVGAEPPVFWADYAAYDHVVLAQLFGDMARYPTGWPLYTRDFELLVEVIGTEAITTLGPSGHDALLEARWLRQAWLDVRALVTQSKELACLLKLFG